MVCECLGYCYVSPECAFNCQTLPTIFVVCAIILFIGVKIYVWIVESRDMKKLKNKVDKINQELSRGK